MTTATSETNSHSKLPLEPNADSRMTNFRWVILGLVFLGTTINYVDRLVMAILVPTLQRDFAITDAQYGYIGSVFGLSYAFGQLISGGILDKIGTRMGYALALTGWSICAMLTSFGRGALSFGVFRAMLGFTESPAFPAAAKSCAEWFPKRQRAFAFGFVNAGTNMGAILAPVVVPWLTHRWGWQSAFIVTGALGFVVLALWLPLYRKPEEHPHISWAELEFIHSDPPEPQGKLIPGVLDLKPFRFSGRISRATAMGIFAALGLLAIGVGPQLGIVVKETWGMPIGQYVGLATAVVGVGLFLWIAVATLVKMSNRAESAPQTNLVGYRKAWVFAAGKFITDPMWWFYMTWLPKFLYDKYQLDLKTIGLPLVTIYVMSDIGSVAGGWLSSSLMRRGFTVNAARKIAFFITALFVLPILLAQQVDNLWVAVILLGLATAGHQGFSSNLYTLCSDMFPKRAVASVAGFGGTFGWIGASIFQTFVGLWVFHFHNYWGPFIVAGLAYLLAFVVIHILAPRIEPAVIDDGPDGPQGFEVIPKPAN